MKQIACQNWSLLEQINQRYHQEYHHDEMTNREQIEKAEYELEDVESYIELLTLKFPASVPPIKTEDLLLETARRQGERRVIDYLKTVLKKQRGELQGVTQSNNRKI